MRMLGLVVLVPLIEELFWRSFLIRWLIDPDFQKVPIGRVTPMAAAVTSVAFALVHPEWLPALLTGALWAWLLWQTRSLTACVVSHATANLALGIYVIATATGNTGSVPMIIPWGTDAPIYHRPIVTIGMIVVNVLSSFWFFHPANTRSGRWSWQRPPPVAMADE